jgi:hypothetical protein
MVDKEQLEYVSPYSAGAGSSDDMTTGQFEYYLAQATVTFNNIDTGLATSTKAHCRLLLVAHFYECSQGRTGFSSEGIGDYSYSRMGPDTMGRQPLTSFMQQVLDICSNTGSVAYQSEAGTRCDSTNLGPFALDNEEQRMYPT